MWIRGKRFRKIVVSDEKGEPLVILATRRKISQKDAAALKARWIRAL